MMETKQDSTMDDGDWIDCDNYSTCKELISSTNNDEEENTIIDDDNNDVSCIHKLREIVRPNQSYSYGDFFTQTTNECITDKVIITAATSEKRENQLPAMLRELEQVAKNNRQLHYGNLRKDMIIKSLREEVNELTTKVYSCQQDSSDKDKMNYNLCTLKKELDYVKSENEKLETDLEIITNELSVVKELHKNCLTLDEIQHKNAKISELSCLLNEAKIQVKSNNTQINYLNECNKALHEKINRISQEMNEVNSKYINQKQLDDEMVKRLQMQIKCLRNDLNKTKEELKEKESAQSKLKLVMKNLLSQYYCKKNEIPVRHNFDLNKIGQTFDNNNNNNYQEEINNKIYDLENDDSQFSDHQINKKEVDLKSLEIEINQMKCDIMNNVKNQSNLNDNFNFTLNIIKRIAKIRECIRLRLQNEQTIYEQTIRELRYLRCQFAQVQNEIETFRLADNVEHKLEINERICKEQELCDAILQAELEVERIKKKLIPLHKTLKNIDKLQEVVHHINS